MTSELPKPGPFDWTVIHNYRHWSLRINTRQANNFGRAIIWLNREGNMRSVMLLTKPETEELWKIVKRYESVMDGLFHPDRYNYLWAGNLENEHGGHGHLHLVPRYSAPVQFEGLEFVDPTYGDMYTSPEETSDRDLVIKIRDALACRF